MSCRVAARNSETSFQFRQNYLGMGYESGTNPLAPSSALNSTKSSAQSSAPRSTPKALHQNLQNLQNLPKSIKSSDPLHLPIFTKSPTPFLTLFPHYNARKIPTGNNPVGVASAQNNSVATAEHLVAIAKQFVRIHVDKHITIVSDPQLAPFGVRGKVDVIALHSAKALFFNRSKVALERSMVNVGRHGFGS